MFTISRGIRAGTRFLRVTYSGWVGLDERRDAFGAVLDEAISTGIDKLLIDFAGADLAPYEAIDGVKFAWQATQLSYLRKIAYVASGNEDDFAISLVRKTYGTEVRVFGSRRAARRWLADEACLPL